MGHRRCVPGLPASRTCGAGEAQHGYAMRMIDASASKLFQALRMIIEWRFPGRAPVPLAPLTHSATVL